MIKTDELIRMETVGIFYQDKHKYADGTKSLTFGQWFNGLKEDVDLTPYLLEAGMFEQ